MVDFRGTLVTMAPKFLKKKNIPGMWKLHLDAKKCYAP